MSCEVLTMCDLRFLPQVLVLHRSLARQAPEMELRVLALDRETKDELEARADPTLRVVDLKELEASDPEAAALRSERLWREYCWTLTPAFCSRAMQTLRPGATLVWIDADIAFYTHPRALIEELGDDSVLLVPHRYDRPYPTSAPPQELAESYGYYNGGTVVLRGDAIGRAAAAHWRERTIEWCHSRVEPGRYGNQRYLEGLVGLPGVRVAASPEIGLAPWNSSYRSIAGTPEAPTVDGRSIVFFHFQSLRIRRRPRGVPFVVLPANYLTPRSSNWIVGRTSAWFRHPHAHRRMLWEPYLDSLVAAADALGPARTAYWDGVARVSAVELREDLRLRRTLVLGNVANAWHTLRSSVTAPARRLWHSLR